MASIQGGTADPYKESEEDFDIRTFQFFLNQKDLYPDPSEDTSWQVYILSRETFGHWALMFESETTGNAFTIELVTDPQPIPNKYEVIMRFVVMDIKKHPKLKQSPLGKITASGYKIFARAYAVLRQMGGYRVFENNCQTYCKLLAKDLGAPVDAATATDHVINGVSTLADVGVIAGIAVISLLISKL